MINWRSKNVFFGLQDHSCVKIHVSIILLTISKDQNERPKLGEILILSRAGFLFCFA